MPLLITKSGSPGRRVLNVLVFVLILIMLYYSITGVSGQVNSIRDGLPIWIVLDFFGLITFSGISWTTGCQGV